MRLRLLVGVSMACALLLSLGGCSSSSGDGGGGGAGGGTSSGGTTAAGGGGGAANGPCGIDANSQDCQSCSGPALVACESGACKADSDLHYNCLAMAMDQGCVDDFGNPLDPSTCCADTFKIKFDCQWNNCPDWRACYTG